MESELDITRSLISKFFDLDKKENSFFQEGNPSHLEMEALLSARISEMLADEMEALINAMYRMDVPEPAFHEAMAHADRAERIAKLVVERLIQKAKTRIWYRDNV